MSSATPARVLTSVYPRSQNTSRVGVLFVHGVGHTGHGDTLIDFGQSFAGWVARWQWAQDRQPAYEAAELNFTPFDPGSDTPFAYAELRLPRDPRDSRETTWVCAEAWYGSSIRPMAFTSMLVWSARYLLALILRLIAYTIHSASRLIGANVSVHDGGLGYRATDFLTSLGHYVGYLLVGVVGYVLLIPIIVMAQIPYEPIQRFVLVTFFQAFLQYNASDLRVYIEDEIQAANVRRRVAEAVGWLTKPAADGGGDCASVVIIAHSGGAWVVHGTLTDDTYAWVCPRVRKFITLGCGLNKIWELAPPTLDRLYRPVTGNIYWVDFWGSYDPVPAGWIQPPRVGRRGSNPFKDARGWRCIYDPGPDVVARHGLQRRADPTPPLARAHAARNGSQPGWFGSLVDRLWQRLGPEDDATAGVDECYWPDSVRVVNRMDALTDHGGYFTNDEEVLRRVASEIQADRYEDSLFWQGHQQVLSQAIRGRRDRVAWLGAARVLAVVAGTCAASAWGTSIAGYLVNVGPIAALLSSAREVLRLIGTVPLAGATLASVWLILLVFVLWAAGAAIASLVAVIPFEVFRALWEANDARQREALLRQTPQRQ